MSQGIQIIGTQRSGSNLLRVMLEESGEIVAPHPPHILLTFIPLMHLYSESTYPQLVRDVVEFIRVNPVPWHGITLNADEIIAKSKAKNIYEVFRLVYEQAAQSKNAKYWCCKSMANVHYAEDMEHNGIAPKYIFLYRDGRDLALSFKKAVVGEKHTYHIAKQWKHDQDACLKLQDAIPNDRFIALSYEDLTRDPQGSLQRMCDFLEIAYTEKMLGFYNSESSKAAAAAGKMWNNLTKPVMSNNSGKFLSEISTEELEVFELVAGDVLKKLGYDTVTSCMKKELLSPQNIEAYTAINQSLKKQVEMGSLEDMEKRKEQVMVLNNIKKRNVSEIVL